MNVIDEQHTSKQRTNDLAQTVCSGKQAKVPADPACFAAGYQHCNSRRDSGHSDSQDSDRNQNQVHFASHHKRHKPSSHAKKSWRQNFFWTVPFDNSGNHCSLGNSHNKTAHHEDITQLAYAEAHDFPGMQNKGAFKKGEGELTGKC